MNEHPSSEEFLARLPTGPGVYLMKDADGRILYVGKAINLRSRVRSYFREGGDGRFLVPFLRRRVEAVETILTESEKEALLLENTLIKKHKPRFNIRLRDDKTYISLRLDTTHKWPRLHRVRKRRPGDKALYFGPYHSSHSVTQTIRFLQRLFPIRSCSDHELETRTRPCILHQIDRCSAPCVDRVSKEEYDGYVEQTLRFLRGRRDEVLPLLREKMEQYSEELQFEKAALVRDRIRALDETVEGQVHRHRAFDRDVIAHERAGGRIVFAVLHFRGGRLDDSSTFTIKDIDLDEPELLEGFLSQHYDTTRDVPRDILVPARPANEEFLRETLVQQRDGAVRLHAPQRGEKRRLIELARQNAAAQLERVLTGQKTVEDILANLQSALHLSHPPRVVHCFDISTFQGAHSVGSMVCFRDGEPDKSSYRRFRIKGIEEQNDFAMMQEMLRRQYVRVQRNEEDPPDLALIDGGIGQLNAAVEVLRDLGLLERIPVAGLAKSRLKLGPGPNRREGKLRTEERIFLPGRKNPVTFRRNDPALHLLQRVRDETHRFGVAYHRLLRNRAALRTGLEDIPGIGPKRRELLLKRFGTLARIKAASLEDLLAVEGISEANAESVWRYFHPDD